MKVKILAKYGQSAEQASSFMENAVNDAIAQIELDGGHVIDTKHTILSTRGDGYVLTALISYVSATP